MKRWVLCLAAMACRDARHAPRPVQSTSFPSGLPLEMLEAILHPPDGDVDPLATIRPHLGRQVAVVGHSLGAMLALTTTSRSEVGVRIALAGTADPSAAGSHLIITGDTDAIAAPNRSATRLEGARRPARSAIVAGAGHLAFTDLCTVGAERGGVLAIAREHGVAVPEMISLLAQDGCRKTDAPFSVTAPVLQALTSGVLEETLRCDGSRTKQVTALGTTGTVDLVELVDAPK